MLDIKESTSVHALTAGWAYFSPGKDRLLRGEEVAVHSSLGWVEPVNADLPTVERCLDFTAFTGWKFQNRLVTMCHGESSLSFVSKCNDYKGLQGSPLLFFAISGLSLIYRKRSQNIVDGFNKVYTEERFLSLPNPIKTRAFNVHLQPRFTCFDE